MANNEGELLADEDVVLRAVHKGDVRQDGTLRHPAFFVSTNGKDNDGLSVTQEVGRALEDLVKITGKDVFCSLTVSVVRQIHVSDDEGSIGSHALDVRSNPTAADQYHALIINMPKMPEQPIPEEILAIRKRAAEHLAKRAKLFIP